MSTGREQYDHHWERQTKVPMDKFDLLAIEDLQNTVSDIHEENLKLAGTDAIWLSRKTTGIKCSCWDRESNQSKYSKCARCYGVGWIGGYDDPVNIKISYDPGKHQVNIENLGLIIDINPSAWTKKTSPPIKTRDIIILKNDAFGNNNGNMRYHVSNATESILADDTRYQDMILSYVGDADVIWDIPVAGASGGFYELLTCNIIINPFHTDLTCSIRIVNPWWP